MKFMQTSEMGNEEVGKDISTRTQVVVPTIILSKPLFFDPTTKQLVTMKYFSTIFSLSALLALAHSNPTEAEADISHVAKLEARGGSATGCVQAHCTMIQEISLGPKSINFQIYWNGQRLFEISGKPGDNLQWNGLKDSQGRQWGFKSVGDCGSLSYINSFQNNYDYYTLTRTSLDTSNHDCNPCTEKPSGKVSCGHCIDKEGVFSDGNSGQCYGYQGLSTCDFRSFC